MSELPDVAANSSPTLDQHVEGNVDPLIDQIGQAEPTDASIVPQKTDSAFSLQLIDENKNFNDQLLPYIKGFTDQKDTNGLNYHIVSVFGSQSTGKSTLLNGLFGTKFDVMDEKKRQQTTKGIWFSHANYIASETSPEGLHNNSKHIFVLDVEGVDGREKADDKDFERKSALFALASTEVLIINIWEHQVGLYQGANMELLKTVLEVNLNLFHSSKQKCLLLFVIRDFTGVTPLSNLADSLRSDLGHIWQEMSKPEGCENEAMESYFDLDFSSIAHKHFQSEEFSKNIRQLGDRFYSEDSLFKPKYHRGIPIDAWAVYSRQIWEQIELNKDLDLPTQQILVARFRCDEISADAYKDFDDEFNKIDFKAIKSDEVIAEKMKSIRTETLRVYDSQASRYQLSVFEERRKKLEDKIDSKLLEVQSERINAISGNLIADFEQNVLKSKKGDSHFGQILDFSRNDCLVTFVQVISIYKISESVDFSKQLEDFKTALQTSCQELKIKEKDRLTSKMTKRFQLRFKEKVITVLSNPSADSWDQILAYFHELEDHLLKKYNVDEGTNGLKYDFLLGLDDDANNETATQIKQAFWIKFKDIIHDFVTEETVARILRNKFEDSFKYDSDGTPTLWRSVAQVDSRFAKARSDARSLLPVLSTAVLEAGQEVIPDVDISHKDDEEEYEEEDDDLPTHLFGHLLTARQESNISRRLKRETDAIYVDAKRSVIAGQTHIPWWMYVLVVVLGWNEITAILRNPMLVMLLVIGASVLYFAYNMQMLGPMISIGKATLNQAKVVSKKKMRDFLIDENYKREPKKFDDEKISESIELDDLNENGEISK